MDAPRTLPALLALALLAACESRPAGNEISKDKAHPADVPTAAATPAYTPGAPPARPTAAPEPSALPAPPDVGAPPADAKKTPSGLASKVITPGTGKDHPTAEDTVKVHYTGWTTDGKMFDSSVTRNEPASFRLDQVIKGWTEGVQLMVAGEKRRFWIPASTSSAAVGSRCPASSRS